MDVKYEVWFMVPSWPSLVRSSSNLLLKTYNNNILIAFKELTSSTDILAISLEENYSL